MKCPKCKNEMKFMIINEPCKKIGIIGLIFWLVLGFLTFGIGLLLIPLLMNKSAKQKKYYVCEKCGKMIPKIF